MRHDGNSGKQFLSEKTKVQHGIVTWPGSPRWSVPARFETVNFDSVSSLQFFFKSHSSSLKIYLLIYLTYVLLITLSTRILTQIRVLEKM